MKRFVFMLVLAGALLVPSAALAGGVVVKVQRATQLIAVTRGKSHVALVHTRAASRLRVGERIAYKARRLHNGTFAGTKVRVVGHVRHVRFQGLLLAKSHARFVLSAGGAVISVARHGRSTASTSDEGPSPGSEVTVNATVGDTGDLEDGDVTTTTPSAPGGKIEGKLTLGTDTVTISSEDMTLALKLPAGFDLSAFSNGEEVLAVFVQQSDGTLLLSGLSGDENAAQADDQGEDSSGDDDGGATTQGDQGDQSGQGDDNDQGDQSGQGDQGDQSGQGDQGDQSSQGDQGGSGDQGGGDGGDSGSGQSGGDDGGGD